MKRLFHWRLPFGRLWFTKDRGLSVLPANLMMATNLIAYHIRGGREVGCYELGSGLVTTAGVVLMAADSTNTTATLKAMKWHASGTGTNTPVIGDTQLQAAYGTRVASINSNIQNTFWSVGTISYTAPTTITEWGLFDANAAGNMWDHKTFTGIAVLASDQLQFVYQLTIAAGG